MKKYFAQLRPLERRLVVAVAVIFVIVLNWWFVWPHFGDWNNLHIRMADANDKLKLYRTAIAMQPEMEKQVKVFQSAGGVVPQEDQAINFIRTIQSQAGQSGVIIENTSRQTTHTNDAFFIEQIQNITVSATDEQLVDFLYKLGSGASMIRVRDLELQPDTSRMRLSANIRLVASYQKNPPAKAPAANPAAISGASATTSSKTPAAYSHPGLPSVKIPTVKAP
jgi:Tfp pilus assembly protein PilO